MFLQQIALYACVGFIMEASGQGWDTSLYWCMLVVIMVSNYLARKEGFHDGLDAANDVLTVANRMLEEAKKHVDDHTNRIELERKALMDTLNSTKDSKENTNV